VDQDEFAEHQVRYGYPPDVIAAAERAADQLHAALVNGTEPFAGGYRRWLELVS
jgi:protein associated with RNAse G/E